jgi:Mrp family chromosome partitioning ATPase
VLVDAAETLAGRPLGEAELERVEQSVRVSVEDQDLSSTLRVEARANTPEGAAGLANAIARGLVDWDRDRARQVLEGSVSALETALADLDAQLADAALPAVQRVALEALRTQRAEALTAARARAAAAVPVGLIAPLRAAEPPERAVGPRLVLNVAIALALGLALGYALVLLRWTVNPNVIDARDLEAAAQLPVLATFPSRARGAPRLSEEAASLLQARLTSLRPTDGYLVVAVATPRSTADQEGVAVGLAESCARSGIPTMLVDADLRSARSTAWLEVNATRTTPYDDASLSGTMTRFEPVNVIVEGNRSFDFVPAFAPARHPVDRVGHVLGTNLEAWTERYQVIVLDAAPVLDRADALVTARRAGGVVLCVGANRTARADVIAAIDVFAAQGIPVLGTVLTQTREARRRSPARTKTAATAGGAAPTRRAPARGQRGAAPATGRRRR